MSASERTPTPRTISDRRATPRRTEELRLNLARELVIEKAKTIADSYTSPLGLDIEGVEMLVQLIDVLRTAEGGVAARQDIAGG